MKEEYNENDLISFCQYVNRHPGLNGVKYAQIIEMWREEQLDTLKQVHDLVTTKPSPEGELKYE